MQQNTRNTKQIARARKTKHVVACGTFDWIHPGHIAYLTHAKKLGDTLTVVIARDKTVRKHKHISAVNDENARLKVVSALKMVDHAVLGNQNGRLTDKIVELQPDVLVLGYDQKANERDIEAVFQDAGLKCKIVRAAPFGEKKFKSSILKRKATKKQSTK